MKKRCKSSVLLISIFILSIFLILLSSIYAADTANQPVQNPSSTPTSTTQIGVPPGTPSTDILGVNPETGNPVATEKIQQIGDAITNAQWTSTSQNNSYLRQELTKILENNNYTAGFVKGYRAVYPYIAPFFKYTVGMDPEMTWLFVLSFIIWCAFVVGFYRLAGLISKEIIIRLILCLIGIVAITSLPQFLNLSKQGVPAILGNIIVNFISTYLWWVQLIIVIVVIMTIVLFTAIPKYLFQIKEETDEKKEKEDEKKDIKKLKTKTEVTDKLTEELAKLDI